MVSAYIEEAEQAKRTQSDALEQFKERRSEILDAIVAESNKAGTWRYDRFKLERLLKQIKTVNTNIETLTFDRVQRPTQTVSPKIEAAMQQLVKGQL